MKFKKILLEILPPVISRYLKRQIIPKVGWIGEYHNWNKVKELTNGYDSDLIIEHVTDSMLKVRNGEYAFERDGGISNEIQYSFPLLSALLLIASKNKNKLNLIDFGGALGSSYYQNKKLLEHLDKLDWSIVEQPKFVVNGKKHFENEELKFYYSIEEAYAESKADTLVLLSVLEYIEKPYELLKTITDLNFKYIIIDRTPFSDCPLDFICKQVVPPNNYEASYPCWIFNEANILNAFLTKYELVYNFSSNFGKFYISKHSVEHKGLFLKRKS